MGYLVDIHIEGHQSGPDSGQEMVTLNTNTKAEAFYRAGSHYFLYEEVQEGFQETCKVKLKITDTLLEITRTGIIDSKLILELGREHTVDYRTPYGVFYIGSGVKEFQLVETEDRLELKVEYTLTESGQFLSDNSVTVVVAGLHKKT